MNSEFMDLRARVAGKRLACRIFKGLALVAAFGVLAIAALLGSLWLEHRVEVTLPTPTGPFAVGRELYDWADDQTLDTLAPVSGTKRELLVWIWYPAAAGQSTMISDYLPALVLTAVERDRGGLIGKFLTRDLSRFTPTVFLTQKCLPSSGRTL